MTWVPDTALAMLAQLKRGGVGAAQLKAVLQEILVLSGVPITPEERAAWQTALGIPINDAVALSSAQIMALSSDPVQLVAAPGAGKVILLTSIRYAYTYGTVAYVTGGPDFYLAPFFDGLDPADSDAAFGEAFTGGVSKNGSQVFSVNGPSSGMENKALMIGATAALTDGDGTAIFGFSYQIYDLATGLIV